MSCLKTWLMQIGLVRVEIARYSDSCRTRVCVNASHSMPWISCFLVLVHSASYSYSCVCERTLDGWPASWWLWCWTCDLEVAIPLWSNNLGASCSHICASVSEQYKLVPFIRQWCPTAWKVNFGLASHSPCIRDSITLGKRWFLPRYALQCKVQPC